MDAVLSGLDVTLRASRRSGRAVLAGAFEAVGVEPAFGIEALRERCFADLAVADLTRPARVSRAG